MGCIKKFVHMSRNDPRKKFDARLLGNTTPVAENTNRQIRSSAGLCQYSLPVFLRDLAPCRLQFTDIFSKRLQSLP